jgi:hypothetical protein
MQSRWKRVPVRVVQLARCGGVDASIVEPARLLFCALSIVPKSAMIHFSHSEITDNRLATLHCGTACCCWRVQCQDARSTGKQHTSPAPVACQHSSQLTTWTAQVERVFGAFASREPQPASARTRAGPDGRANSTTLRSGARPTGKMVAEWPAPAHDHGRSARNLAHTKPRARRAAAANHTHSDTAEGPRALLKVSNPEWRRTVASVAERQDSSKSSARSAMRAVLFSDVDCEYPPTHPPRGTRP